MIIQPKIRGFICTAAHPAGCHEHVKRQMQTILDQPSFPGPANALIVGASTGYGLSSRIALAFGANCPTIGVFFEIRGHSKFNIEKSDCYQGLSCNNCCNMFYIKKQTAINVLYKHT